MTTHRTDVDTAEISARRAAVNVGDLASRTALVDQIRQAAAICLGAYSGLHVAEPAGHILDSGIGSHLELAEMLLGKVAEEIAANNLWMTQQEQDEIDADRAAVDADYIANPMYMVTGEQLAGIRTRAFLAGAEAVAA